MLRRSICCQHNKLVFSKANWYTMALKAVLPPKTSVTRAIQFQRSKCIATMAATALDDVQPDTTTEIQPLPPLEPLSKQEIPKDMITVKGKSTMSHFKRCSGHKTWKAGGGQCTRLVKIDIEQAEEHVYCYNHYLKAQNDKHLATFDKKAVSPKQPTHHAKRKKKVKQPVTRLTSDELEKLIEKVHNHVHIKERQLEQGPPAPIKKVKSRKGRVNHAKEQAVLEQLEQLDPPQSQDNVVCHDHSPALQTEEDSLAATLEKTTLHQDHTDDAKESDVIHDCWQLWIGDHIAPKRKALIRQVMKDPVSDRDKAGYIYGFLLDDGPRVSQEEHAYFKVGRAENPQRRMYQLARTCNFIPKIVEVIPKFPEKPSAQDKQQWIMPANGIVETDDNSNVMETKCPMSHRVERLIHLELASQYQRAGFKCDECGSTHREWFRIDRRRHPNGQLMTDQELWHSDIRPIVLKWIQFGVVATALKS